MSTKQPEPQPPVSDPASPAKPARKPRARKPAAVVSHALEPLDLSALKKNHILRVGLNGRKGAWVGHLVSAEPQEQRLTIKVKWIKEPRTVSFADIASAEARTADTASRYVPVQLDA